MVKSCKMHNQLEASGTWQKKILKDYFWRFAGRSIDTYKKSGYLKSIICQPQIQSCQASKSKKGILINEK